MSETPFSEILDKLLAGGYLTRGQATELMDEALAGNLGPERLAALITALRAKSPAVDEVVGFARSMRAHAVPISCQAPVILDNCGTGGAPFKAFNVSTITAFVLAAGGVVVAKHGNRSVTRPSGSADALEAAGLDLSLAPGTAEQLLATQGIAFLFAPAFHPAMRHAGPVRQALGIKTIFNLLGPLTNPAGATHQVLGIFDPGLIPLMADALARLGCKSGFVLHGDPGFDEATPCGTIHYARVQDGHAGPIETLDPADLGLPLCSPEDIAPVAVEEVPELMEAILSGRDDGPRSDTVALNAAFGFVAAGVVPDLPAGLAKAQEILQSGAGKAKMDAYLEAARP